MCSAWFDFGCPRVVRIRRYTPKPIVIEQSVVHALRYENKGYRDRNHRDSVNPRKPGDKSSREDHNEHPTGDPKKS